MTLRCLLPITMATLLLASQATAAKDVKGKLDEKSGIVVQYDNYVLNPGYLIEGKAQNQSKASYTRVVLNFKVFDKDGDPLGGFKVHLSGLPSGAKENFRLQWLRSATIDGYRPATVQFVGAETEAGASGPEKLGNQDAGEKQPQDAPEGKNTEPEIKVEKRDKTFVATDAKSGVTVEYEWVRPRDTSGSGYRTYIVTGKVRRNSDGPSVANVTVHFAALARDGDKLGTNTVFAGRMEHGGFYRFETSIRFEFVGDRLKNIAPFKIEMEAR